MSEKPLRLAMWSGPRNISTAMMRSWGNRDDTAVTDEPLYAHYLNETGRDHQGAAEVIAAGQTDETAVINSLLGPVPGGKAVWFQKHMSHHLLPKMDRAWLKGVTNCFLIRDPRDMLTSLVKHVPDMTLADTGYPQQVEIFKLVLAWTGHTPPVLDAKDILDAPERLLGALCNHCGVEFSEKMLSWPPGLRETDGVWAKYWYKEVETTTGFRPYRPKDEKLDPKFNDVLESALALYEQLHAYRMRGN